MENAPDMSAGSRKILTSAEAEAGELLVKFSKESIAAVEAGVTRSNLRVRVFNLLMRL